MQRNDRQVARRVVAVRQRVADPARPKTDHESLSDDNKSFLNTYIDVVDLPS